MALQVTDVIYDAQQGSAVVYTMQHLTPKLLPFLTFQFPLITKLKLSSGQNKVHLLTCWHRSFSVCVSSRVCSEPMACR